MRKNEPLSFDRERNQQLDIAVDGLQVVRYSRRVICRDDDKRNLQ